MTSAYLYAAARTPFGRFGGALAEVRPDDLAAAAIVKAWYVTMRPSVIDACSPDQRLTIVAWDQS